MIKVTCGFKHRRNEGTEILTGKVRVLYASLGVCLCFACGYMMLPVFAFLLRDWTSLLLALSLPGLLYIPLWWCIPESPRWLLSQGRVEEAEAILRQAARKNKVDAPQVIFSVPEVELREGRSNTEEHHSVLDLLRNSTVRTTTAILCLMWFTLSTSYFALSLNTANMNGDPYINCLISAAMEVPAYVLSWLALRSLSRRLSASGSMLLSSVALYLIQLVPPSLPDIAVALEMLGKFGAATGTALAFAYTGELYPTVIRNTAVGVCAMVSRVGSAIAPYFIQLSLYNTDLPNIVLGTLTVLSSLAILFLPETFGRPLPETIQDMNKIGRIKCPCTTAEDKEVHCVEEILL